MAVYASSEYSTVTGTSQAFTTALSDNNRYVLASNVNCWFRTDGSAATVGASSHFLPAGGWAEIRGEGSTLAIIKDTGEADGRASLSLVTE